MKKLLAILCLVALPLVAQQPAEPTPDQLRQIGAVMRQQRDTNAQALQDAQAQLTILAQENESLKKQLAEAQAKLADATKPKTAEPTAADKNLKTEIKLLKSP